MSQHNDSHKYTWMARGQSAIITGCIICNKKLADTFEDTTVIWGPETDSDHYYLM